METRISDGLLRGLTAFHLTREDIIRHMLPRTFGTPSAVSEYTPVGRASNVCQIVPFSQLRMLPTVTGGTDRY